MGLVSELNLKIGRASWSCSSGPNGAGKSTMLGLTLGDARADQRLRRSSGHPAGTIEARAALSYLPDDPVLYDDLSLGEHIEYVARLHQTQEWEEYADDLVEMFGLTDRIDDLPSRFSRGLKQKTGIILGLIRPFRVMLIDEPFVGLDTPGQETLVEILSDVVEQGATVVCSTHQLDLVPERHPLHRPAGRRPRLRRQGHGGEDPRARRRLTRSYEGDEDAAPVGSREVQAVSEPARRGRGARLRSPGRRPWRSLRRGRSRCVDHVLGLHVVAGDRGGLDEVLAVLAATRHRGPARAG